MSLYTQSEPHTRRLIKLKSGPMSEAFIMNALQLSSQQPRTSGIFFAKFLATFFGDVALGELDSFGERLVGIPCGASKGDCGIRRDAYAASVAYRKCHQLKELYGQLRENISPELALQLEPLQEAYEEQAALAASFIHSMRKIEALYKSIASAEVKGEDKDEGMRALYALCEEGTSAVAKGEDMEEDLV